MPIENDIRAIDLEAGWQRYAGLRWRNTKPQDLSQVQDVRNAFGAGAAWMFELLINLGERPHEFAARIDAARNELHAYALRTRTGTFKIEPGASPSPHPPEWGG